jgi:hypothetical protein
MLKYKIKLNDKIVAKFKYAGDRDLCIDLLRKIYPEIKYEEVN